MVPPRDSGGIWARPGVSGLARPNMPSNSATGKTPVHFRRDRAPVLHRRLSGAVRRRRDRSRGRRPPRLPRPHRVLSHLRRPAVRHRPARRGAQWWMSWTRATASLICWADRSRADRLEGSVDWPRRFDHMQQHTGQHLLSAVVADRFGYTTVSVHFGRESSTLDLETGAFTPEQVIEAETRANAAVMENRAVRVSSRRRPYRTGPQEGLGPRGHAPDRHHRGARPERLWRNPRPRDRRDRSRSPSARSSG